MKNVIKILLMAWVCMATKCADKESENCHTAIRFSNNSKKDVRVKISSANLAGFNSPNAEQYRIKSGEQDNRRALSRGGCIEQMYRMSPIYVYVFDAAVIENTPWEVVVRDNLVLKRYNLTLEDLQRLNWSITYPPTEAMKDVIQEPPYGSD